jgi:hypothetical protein
MRHNQNNRRSRGRSRKGPNPLTRSFESNGPDVKVRGTASHVAEKYMTLARDAISSGDIVAAENYYQHAEHYNRIVAAAQAQFQQSQPQQFRDGEEGEDDGPYNGRSFEGGGAHGYEDDDDRQGQQGYDQPGDQGREQGRGGQQGYGQHRDGGRGQQNFNQDRNQDRGPDRNQDRNGQRPQRRYRDDERSEFGARDAEGRNGAPRDFGRDQGRDQNREQNRGWRESGRDASFEGGRDRMSEETGNLAEQNDAAQAAPEHEQPRQEIRSRSPQNGDGGDMPAPKAPRKRRERAVPPAASAEAGDEPQSDGEAALAAFPD